MVFIKILKMKFKRILLKLSGEVLKGGEEFGIEGKTLMSVAKRIKRLHDKGVDIAIVVGGGNIWRFRDNEDISFKRTTSDTMGMLATVMNALALEAALAEIDCPVEAFSNLNVSKAMKDYSPKFCQRALSEKKVVILAGGTGHSHFTTDSAAALMCLELGCDALFKATKVDFVYDKDPVKFTDAKKYLSLTYQEVLDKQLGVMDLTCASLMQQSSIPMVVFNFNSEDSILRVIECE